MRRTATLRCAGMGHHRGRPAAFRPSMLEVGTIIDPATAESNELEASPGS